MILTTSEAKKKIDILIEELQKEYLSKHITLTKIINYEYLTGKYHEIIELFYDLDQVDDFVELTEYRRFEIDTITNNWHWNIINPFYDNLKELKNITWR